MIKMHELREMIKLLDQSSITEFEMESDGTKISIKKGAAALNAETSLTVQDVQAAPAAPVVQAATTPKAAEQSVAEVKVQASEPKPAAVSVSPDDEANYHKIVSPMVGTFYSKPEPTAEPYVKVGDKVKNDSIVCIVEAMKLFNEIEAEVTGEIVKVLVNDGQLVEYGQPLFLVKTE